MLYARFRDLQSMCLHAIAANIKIFVVNNNHIPQKYMDFLHRTYGDTLFPLVMCDRHTFVMECMLWFLTPYKKQVTFRSLDSHTQDVLEKMHGMGSLITSLNLTDCFTSESLLSSLICCVPNVKRLTLRRTTCTDQVFLCLMQKCPSLITLDLRETGVTDQGIERICSEVDTVEGGGTFALKSLDVTETRVTEKGISLILKYVPYLEVLRHEDISVILYDLHHADIHNCDKTAKYNLTEFMHSASDKVELLSILKVWTILCPNIRTIVINDVISEMHVSIINRFTQLEEVSFISYKFPRITAEATSVLCVKGEMLSTLSLAKGTISVKTLVQYCRNLKSICFRDITYEDFPEHNLIAELNPLYSLKSLTVRYFDFSDSLAFESVSFLIKLSCNLKEICISFAKNVSEEFIQVILNSCPKLWLVDFSFTDIKTPSLLHFFNCKTVERIYADSCENIGEESDDPFRNFLDFNYKQVFSWQTWSGIDEYEENDDVKKFIDDPTIDFPNIEE